MVRPDPVDKRPEELCGEAGPHWMLPFSPPVGAFPKARVLVCTGPKPRQHTPLPARPPAPDTMVLQLECAHQRHHTQMPGPSRHAPWQVGAPGTSIWN